MHSGGYSLSSDLGLPSDLTSGRDHKSGRDHGRPKKLRALAEMWRQWSDLARRDAQRHKTLARVNPQAYHELYTELLAAVRELKAGAKPKAAEFFEAMEEMLRPWVTAGSIQSADREIVYRVSRECAQVQRRLDGACGIGARRWRARVLLVAGGVLTSILAIHIFPRGSRRSRVPPVWRRCSDRMQSNGSAGWFRKAPRGDSSCTPVSQRWG